jgi:hypothetical protein
VSVGALSACSADADDEPTTPSGETVEAAAETGGVDVVGEDGLTLELDGVTVEFPAGSATGAEVDAEGVAATSAPGEVEGADAAVAGVPLLPLADGVMVSLDGGSTQPSVPVEVTFALPADVLPDPGAEEEALDVEVEPTLAEAVAAGNVAFAVQSDDGSVEVVPATFDETTGTVTGQVPHFSGIWPVSLDVSAMVDTVLQTLGVTSERPDCEGKPAEIGDETYTVNSDPLMWMCVEATPDGAGLVVTARANAPFPFIGEPDVAPDDVFGGGDLSSSGIATQLATEILRMVPDGKVAVFPGGDSRMTYAEAPGALDVEFVAAPNLLLLSVLAEVGATAFGMTPAEFATMLGRLDCMSEVGELFSAAADGLTPTVGASLSTAFFTCAGEAVELSPAQAVVVALFTAAPQLLIGTLWGAVTTAAGASNLDIPIHVTGGPDPVTAAEFEPFLGTWSGPVNQPGSRYYGMEVTISMGADGKPTAQVRYPELSNCSGYWDSPILSGRTLAVVEHIETSGTSCVDEVDIKVRRVGDELRYWTVGGYDARATLSRGPYEPPVTNQAAWPTGADEGPPALTMWLGANLYAFPEWVACDDARAWCLVGGTSEHMLVQLDGLSDRGRVPDASPDPIAAMVRLGAPRASATQIME